MDSKARLIFNSLAIPWTSIGNWATNVVRYSNDMATINAIDTHLLNTYLNLGGYLSSSYLIPLLWIPIYLLAGTIINFSKRNNWSQS